LVVFHLAAYKHVPFGEADAGEPVGVNILGTTAVVDASEEHGVRHLVYPSSDKAVNPPSAYGATKRLAEALLSAHAAGGRPPAPHIVRYVNIIGSSGSVLETFLHQLRSGRPLTLTDLRMTRYWMAMEEAVALLLHALGLPPGSRTLLDSGPSIPVATMGERLYRLVQSERGTPEFDVVGARPGESLAEELTSVSEEVIPRVGEPISDILDTRAEEHTAKVAAMVDELRVLIDGARPEMLRKRLMRMAQALQ
jgi:FlaA1/EpsC-like NDP-sugar epimerase